VWNVKTGLSLMVIEIPSVITDIAWSPDGTRLAAGDNKGLIHIWQQP
jgi:WD40 repeat protein